MKNRIANITSVMPALVIIASVSGIPATIFGHTRMFSIFGVAMVVLLFCILFLNKYKEFSLLTKKDFFCFIFLLFYLIDVIFLDSLWNVGIYCLIMLFVLLRCLRQIRYTIIFGGCLCATFICASWGYLQYFGVLPSNNPYHLLTGPFHNPAVLASMLALLLGVTVNTIIGFFPFLRKHSFIFVCIITIIVFCAPVIVLLHARAAWVALLGSILYGLYRKVANGISRRKRLFYCSGGLLLVLLLSGASYTLKPQSAKGRLLIWKVGIQMVSDRPFSGFGKGGFAANYLYYQAEYLKSSASSEEKRLAGSNHLAFNEPLRVAVEQGLIGLMIYLVFVIWMLLPGKKDNTVSGISKSLLVGIVVWGLFDNVAHTFPVLLLWVMGMAYSLGRRKIRYPSIYVSINITSKILGIIVCCFVITVGGMLCVKWKSYHGLQSYLNNYQVKGRYELSDALNIFRKGLEGDISFAFFYCRVLKEAHCDSAFLHSVHFLENHFPTSGLFVMKGDYWQGKRQWAEAEKAYKLAADMIPSLQIPRGKLALLYKETGRKKEALDIVHQLLTEEVKVYGFDTYILHRDLKRIFEDELK